jgi:hypothetical protein
MALPSYNRLVRDANLRAVTYLPAAGSTAAASPSFNLGSGTFKPEEMEIEVALPAMTNRTSASYTITATLQDSADNITFANTNPLIQCGVIGVASTGSPATTFRFRPPANVRQYIQVLFSVPSGDATNTGVQVVVQVLL